MAHKTWHNISEKDSFVKSIANEILKYKNFGAVDYKTREIILDRLKTKSEEVVKSELYGILNESRNVFLDQELKNKIKTKYLEKLAKPET